MQNYEIIVEKENLSGKNYFYDNKKISPKHQFHRITNNYPTDLI